MDYYDKCRNISILWYCRTKEVVMKELSWKERYARMIIDWEFSEEQIADITGNSLASVKSVTQPSKEIPRWLRLAIVISEQA